MALICCWVGRRAGAAESAAGAEGTAAGGAVATAGGAAVAGATAAAGGAAATGAASGVAPARPVTTAWQAGERSVALALRHSTSSGLLGAMNEQCAAASLSVHALLTAASSCCGVAAAGLAAGDSAATGVSGCALALSASAFCESGMAVSDFGATALTAAPHAADNWGAWLARHSKASRPPGWTPMQCEMKSLRQAPRIA